MASAISLHVGLNRIDKAHYGTSAPLRGCENDANDMKAILAACGFETRVLLNEQATSNAILSAFDSAASRLSTDGIFVFTYAGHGSQLKDLDGDEGKLSGNDQTLCVYDRMVLDDELYARWKKFPAGARIVLISDSCHSGTIARQMFFAASDQGGAPSLRADASLTTRNLPVEALDFMRTHWLDEYQARRSQQRSIEPDELAASIIQISGCQDNQTSTDTIDNGVFTGNLIKVWAKGRFSGGYPAFHRAIVDRMPSNQNPNYWALGAAHPTFENEKPFTIGQGSARPANGGAKMVTLHPAVEALVRGRNGSGARAFDVDVESARDWGGSLTITVSRDVLTGKSDREILDYFSRIVAPEMCSNFFMARDCFSGKQPRGGEFSCSVDTKGNAECKGTWRF